MRLKPWIYLVVLSLIVSCAGDDAPVCGGTGPYGFVFRIRTANDPVARALGEEYDEEGSAAENRIDMEGGDYRVFLFRGAGDGAMFISELRFDIAVRNERCTEYVVWVPVPEDFFTRNGIDPAARTSYRLMMLANWQSLGGVYPEPETGTTVADILGLEATFEAPPAMWNPFEDGARGIPMYGLLSFEASQDELLLPSAPTGSATEEFEGIKTLYLLRALAKIEIIDDLHSVQTPEEERFPRIESVAIGSYNTTGRLIPADFVNGQQVADATFPIDVATGTEARNATVGERDGRAVYQCYMAESPIVDGMLKITVRNRPSDMPQTATYTADLVSLFGTDAVLLRNHIYRFSLKSVASTMRFSYVVCPFDEYVSDEIPPFE